MSDRERWIVYPLLFLAIGMSLRDKQFPTKRVLTQKLIVLNDKDESVVEIGATADGNGAIRARRGDRTFTWPPSDEEILSPGRTLDWLRAFHRDKTETQESGLNRKK
jgi:hypothetical protein